MQFLGLKSTAWREKLNEQLRRVGYQLGDIDESFDDEVAVSPFGHGDSFVLHIKYYDYVGWHAYLYPAADAESDDDPESIADWCFDASEMHLKSCYDVWIDWIVHAVGDAANPNRSSADTSPTGSEDSQMTDTAPE